MSAERFEISDHGSKLTVRDTKYGSEVSMLRVRSYSRELTVMAGAIRQQARDIAELRAELQMCCELKREYQERAAVAAEQADQLRTDLAAAVSENAALLAANRDLKAHFDALKGDYDEAAHFARHFIRDDAAITPRGAIIRLGDKCTDLFVRLQQAEARLAAIDAQPTVAEINDWHGHLSACPTTVKLPPVGTQLIARPAKD